MTHPALSVGTLVFFLDQASKNWIVEHFRPDTVFSVPYHTPERIEVLPVFDLVMTWNRGVSFGIFNNDGPWNAVVLSALSLAIVGFLIAWIRKTEKTHLVLALGAIAGGALGNVIDRMRWGAVADFLDFHVAGWHWPAFNVADSAITLGALVLVLDSLFGARDSTKV